MTVVRLNVGKIRRLEVSFWGPGNNNINNFKQARPLAQDFSLEHRLCRQINHALSLSVSDISLSFFALFTAPPLQCQFRQT